MSIIGAAALGGLAGITGNVIGGALGYSAQNATNRLNYKMFQESREDQNTAHQRAVADMRKAGLNPILAAGQPAGTQAPIKLDSGAEHLSKAGAGAGASAQGAFDTASARYLQQRTIEQQNEMNQANIGYIDAQTRHLDKQNELIDAQTGNTTTGTVERLHQIENLIQERGIKDYDWTIAKNSGQPYSSPMGSGIFREILNFVRAWQDQLKNDDGGTLGIGDALKKWDSVFTDPEDDKKMREMGFPILTDYKDDITGVNQWSKDASDYFMDKLDKIKEENADRGRVKSTQNMYEYSPHNFRVTGNNDPNDLSKFRR